MLVIEVPDDVAPWVKNLPAADAVGRINAGLAGEFTGRNSD
jgi:hypothetical protein